jgi:AraC-like DNA-binding protein
MIEKSRPDRIDFQTVCDGLVRAEARLTGRAFSPHRHDSYAIGYTTAGVQAFDYRGATHRSLPGDVFVLHPDELHDGRAGTDSAFGYRILYVSPDLVSRAAETGELPFVRHAVSDDPRLKAIVARVLADDGRDGDLYHADLLRALADALCRAADRPFRKTEPGMSTTMARIRERLLDDPAEGVGMAELEREFGMSRYAISRGFRRAFGVSPCRFVVLRRLGRAMDLIRGGAPLVEAALAAGFADQSHFTRRFRAAHGMTPARWRALVA